MQLLALPTRRRLLLAEGVLLVLALLATLPRYAPRSGPRWLLPVVLLAALSLAILLGRVAAAEDAALSALADAMRAAGEGDFTSPVPAPAPGAVGRLAGDLAQMRRQLQMRQVRALHTARMEAVAHLAGGVAHDFNNLLTVINGYSELVLERMSGGDANAAYIEHVSIAGRRAATLTRQLLAFSRKDVAHPEITDLNAVLIRLQRMLATTLGPRIELHIRTGTDVAPVFVDRAQMEHVILQLAANARDAMPAGGRLEVSTENFCAKNDAGTVSELPFGRYVLMSVVDSGIGMSAETQQHLFEPFFTTKEVGKGAGLGLAAIYGIVNQSRGSIRVKSQPNEGARFDVFLPAAEDAGAAGATAEATAPAGETVLLVEDDEGVRALVRELLLQNGYNVLTAGDGLEALDLVEKLPQPVDLVFTDIVMPKMGGRALITALARRWPRLRVVYTSGYPEKTIANYGIDPDRVRFLPKPFTPAALVRTISDMLHAPAQAGAAKGME